MITFVIDASVLVELFARDELQYDLRRRVLTGAAAAPELIDVESANVLRKMVLRKEIPTPEAHEALGNIRDSPVVRVSHRPLLERVWQLRENLTCYDASYVALAEQLGVPLLTCDGRLAKTRGHGATIEVFARA